MIWNAASTVVLDIGVACSEIDRNMLRCGSDDTASLESESNSVVEFEFEFQMKMRVSQYSLQTSSCILSHLQGPTRAVRSGEAERRRQLTAKKILRVDLGRAC